LIANEERKERLARFEYIMAFNLITSISRSGYGYHGLNVFKAAWNMGIEVALWPTSVDINHDEHKDILRGIAQQTYYNYFQPSVSIAPASALALHVGKGARVGWPAFELNRFTKQEKHHLGSQDILLVASAWAKGIINREVPGLKCEVVHLGVDRDIFSPDIPVSKDDYNDATVFINIGKWEKRKAQEEVLDAFNKAFEPHDNVLLIFACNNPFNERINSYWINLCNQCKMAPKIKTLNQRFDSQREIAKLMSAADCGIFPSRGEGWNLELLEMMSMGKKVIATNYSAHTEYCNAENCLLVDIDDYEPAHDGLFFFGDGEWATIGSSQCEQMILYMRQIHHMRSSGFCLINYPGMATAESFTWRRSVQSLMSAIGD